MRTLVVVGTMEMGEYRFLEGLDLILKTHEVRYSFVPKRNTMSGIYHENNTLILPPHSDRQFPSK